MGTLFATFTFKRGIVGMWDWSMSAVGEPLVDDVVSGKIREYPRPIAVHWGLV